MKGSRHLPRLAARFIALAMAGGCRANAPAPSPPPPASDGPALTLAVRADVTGFFPGPRILDEAYTYDINWSIYEGLVRFNERLEPEPALAERWENPDDRTYIFQLRAARFSDGRPLRAADVTSSLKAALERGWVNRGYLHAVERVEAVGDRQVRIRTRFPYFVLLSRLPWGLVIPADAVDGAGPAPGTGPYRLQSRDPGRGFVLVRNPHYQGRPAGFATARFVVVPDPEERLRKVAAGEVDVADQVPLDAAERLAGRSDLKVFASPTLRVLYLILRTDAPPLADARVREAIDSSLDRQELVGRVYRGRTVVATQLVPPAVAGYNPAIALARVDRARARRRLAEAGYPRGFSLRLDGTHNRYVYDREILDEVARQLGLVGVRVEVNAMDKREFFPLAFGGRSPFHLIGWECQSGEAGQALDAIAHSRARSVLGSANTAGLADPLLDELIEEGNRTPDVGTRTLFLQRALARVARLRVALPLLVQAEAVAVSSRVEWNPSVRLSLSVETMRPAARP